MFREWMEGNRCRRNARSQSYLVESTWISIKCLSPTVLCEQLTRTIGAALKTQLPQGNNNPHTNTIITDRHCISSAAGNTNNVMNSRSTFCTTRNITLSKLPSNLKPSSLTLQKLYTYAIV